MFFALAIAGVAVYFLLKQSVRIDIGTPAVSFLAATGDGMRINVKLTILNRSDLSYPIDGFLGQLLYGNTALGNVLLKQATIIPARSGSEMEFTALINWSALASEAYSVLDAGGVIQWLKEKIGLGNGTTPPPGVSIDWKKFRIKGTLYVGNVGVDIDQNLV